MSPSHALTLLSTLTLASILTTLASCAPTTSEIGSFVRDWNRRSPALFGASQPYKSKYNKYATRRPFGRRADDALSNDTLPLVQEANIYAWETKVTVGGSTVLLDLDTGSNVLVLQPGVYKPTAESKDLGKNVEIHYGPGDVDEAVKAKLYTDTVTFAGLTAHDVKIASITGAKTPYFPGGADGLMGMGHPFANDDVDPANGNNFFDQLAKQGKWAGTYTFDIEPQGGSLSFGDPPSQTTWAKSVSTDQFTVKGSLSSGGGKGTPIELVGLIDSGTSAIIVSLSAAKRLAAQIGGTTTDEGDIIADCSVDPQIEFQFEGFSIPISKELLYKGTELCQSDKGELQLCSDGGKPNGKCTSSIQGVSGVQANEAIIGDVLFLAAKITFDYPGHRVGFAPK